MITAGFTIAITCHACRKTSHSLDDVANLYCGHCHDWHARPADLPPAAVATRLDHVIDRDR